MHIGAPKCGSTFLQRVLIQNNSALNQAGIHYPAPDGPYPGNARLIAQLDRSQLDRYFENGIHTVLLSHENLLERPQAMDAFSKLTKEAGITLDILVFFRPYCEIVSGIYSERLKENFERFLRTRSAFEGRSFAEFVQTVTFRKTSVNGLSGWRRRFPHASLRIIPHREIRQTYETFLGNIPGFDWTLTSALSNPSFRLSDCEAIAQAINTPQASVEDIRALFEVAVQNRGKPDLVRSPDRDLLVDASFLVQNQKIFAEFGYDNRKFPKFCPF